jgi:two-component sensor histidine kinase/PAS domain-containing protein
MISARKPVPLRRGYPVPIKSQLRQPISDIMAAVQIGTYEWWPATDLVRWSPELMAIYGLQVAPATEAEFGARLHPLDRTRVEGETSSFLGSNAVSYSHVFRILRPDGNVRIILDRAAIDRDAAGKVLRVRGVNVDVTDDIHFVQALEDRLRASEGRYRKLFEAIDEGFCIVEVKLAGPDGKVDYRVIEANPAFYAKTGFRLDVLGAWLRQAAPELEDHWFETYGEVARTGAPIRFVNASKLLGRWFDVYAFPIDAPEDHRVAILFNDITDRKAQEAHTRTLVDEINHRSKNMLGVIQAIARQTAVAGTEGFLDRFGERVRALAASNDLLARNGWGAVPLEELVRSQLTPFADQIGHRILLQGPEIQLNAAATRTLGMAFHELATNAAKYGALAESAGMVRIDWSVTSEPGPRITITWAESGGLAVTPPTRIGFGSKVTKQMVEAETKGSVTVNFAPDGLSWCLAAPLDRLI